jgi:hypothetical protein
MKPADKERTNWGCKDKQKQPIAEDFGNFFIYFPQITQKDLSALFAVVLISRRLRRYYRICAISGKTIDS